jgi:mono/diheme cytochrome c family protein
MRLNARIVLAAGGLVAAGVGAVLWLWPSSMPAVALTPDDPEVVVQGRQIYQAHCASCHGAELEGQPNWRERGPDGRLPAPPHDASGHTWHHPDVQLFRLTKLGPAGLTGGSYESDMPAYADTLTDSEILAVLSYIKSTWPPEVRTRHDQINVRAAP